MNEGKKEKRKEKRKEERKEKKRERKKLLSGEVGQGRATLALMLLVSEARHHPIHPPCSCLIKTFHPDPIGASCSLRSSPLTS